MLDLLTGLVPGIPEAAANAVVARADGIPLYAVETVRMLIAERRLEERDGIYVPTGPLDALAVPETLQALIAARLDALDPADRSLLQDAGVLGHSFSAAALAAVSGRDEADVETRLRALARREVVNLVTDPRSPERGQWSFSQALIREVAYGSLGRRDRRTRHLAAARYFEAIEGPEVAGALAYHYLDAYRAAPEGAEGEAVAGQARIALRAAAERAAALGSSEQALAYLESALEVTTDPADEADLHQRAGAAADARADRDRAGEHYSRAIELWRGVGDRSAALRCTVAHARSLGNHYRLDQAVALLEPALETLGDLAGTADGLALLGELARVEMLRERSNESTALADRALEDAEALALRPAIADLLITKGVNYTNVGRGIEGRAILEAGIRIADQDGLVLTGLRGRINLAGCPSIEPRSGLAVAREAMETARRIGNRRAESSILGDFAFAALGLGAWDELLAEVQVARASYLVARAAGEIPSARGLTRRADRPRRDRRAGSRSGPGPRRRRGAGRPGEPGTDRGAVRGRCARRDAAGRDEPSVRVGGPGAGCARRRVGRRRTCPRAGGRRTRGDAHPGLRDRRQPDRDPGLHRRPRRAPCREHRRLRRGDDAPP